MKGPAEIAHLFVASLAKLDKQLPKARKAMTTDGAIWVSDQQVCAVDEKWSGLKLVIRKALR